MTQQKCCGTEGDVKKSGIHKAYLRVNNVNLDERISGPRKPETLRRRAAGWHKFLTIIDVSKVSSLQYRAAPSNHYTEAMTFGSETWASTKAEKNILAVMKSAMERRMLRVSVTIKNNWTLRQTSGVNDIVVVTRKTKSVGRNTPLTSLTTSERRASLIGKKGIRPFSLVGPKMEKNGST